MKSILACALIASLATSSVSVAAEENPWWAIRECQPGTKVTLRTARLGPDPRYLIRADDDSIMLLNVSDRNVPPDVAKLLRRILAEHPDYFPVPVGRTIALDSRTYLSTSGVVVAGQKIADYDQVVERIPRADVEGGVVVLEVKPAWSVSKQILTTVGVAIGAVAALVISACGTKGCD